jgi:ankyrin repeat protein
MRQNGYQDLMEAVVISGKDEILRLMMDNNVDMNLASDEGCTALLFAVAYEHERMVKMLLGSSSGVIVNQKDGYGCTALHCTAEYYNRQITKMLIQSGADVNGLADQGNSPLITRRHGAIKPMRDFCSMLVPTSKQQMRKE